MAKLSVAALAPCVHRAALGDRARVRVAKRHRRHFFIAVKKGVKKGGF
jgi:hypothetical protein